MDLEILKQKLNNSQALYSDEETNWLLDNIGDSKSEIRDDLVCNSLGAGFLEEKFTERQILFLIKQLRRKNLLFYCIKESREATLTRSFTCLLWDLIIRTNNDRKSRYYQVLNKNEERQIFEDLIKYLENEHDFTGFSPKYGWVHAVAHCSDALSDSILCDNFDQKMVADFLLAVKEMLDKVDRRFINGEEYRLADVFVNGFKANKINSGSFVNWIEAFTFDPYSDELLEYYRFNNLKSLLQDIYVKLNSISLLDPSVKEIVEKKFNSEY
ncbi:DUF2785 domain-containing protein [Lactobacillus intestinalis]|uniref:DUF2785 domain-containing protein n=1 Tax=Lactobacillus intestinalis DSM 6629 TaxID=1423761 RepID=A0ABR5PNH3_9LACO|nr:DUF2785 domain-containing protein [Lactobacillus intestinalis]KRM31732.1 hypothetical protein FC44_GL000430 [Lactobacillus intestinalis DSM 6629]UTW41254.1 DUF2785 domain-containing protein [Lactobacillus intestinalis]